MCKNAKAPCPGCTKYVPTDAMWMFFTDQERELIEADTKNIALFHHTKGSSYPLIALPYGS